MKIVIAGAGGVGFHLAELLSYENQDITLIDTNKDVLEYAASHLDVLTILGDAASEEVLAAEEIHRARLFLAVTTHQHTNLVAAQMAKQKGAKQTIARVAYPEYLEEPWVSFFRRTGVDSLISPRKLAASEIKRLVRQCSFTDVLEFENGKMVIVGFTLDEHSPLLGKPLRDITHSGFYEGRYRPIAILRGNRTIIPHGDTVLRFNDHVYFISPREELEKLEAQIGRKHIEVKRVMIVGGSGLGYETARLLEKDYQVTLVDRDKERCRILSELLHDTLVIHGDASDIDLLREEGLEDMDVLIAVTPNSETNIITSLMAKNYGVGKTIARVENKEYTYISQNIGVDTLINVKLIAANNIFRFVRKGKVESLTTLHGVEAEVIEFVVAKDNRLTRKRLRDLHLPQKALIGGVIRGEESFIPDGDFRLQVGDKVIVFAMPEAIPAIEKMFR